MAKIPRTFIYQKTNQKKIKHTVCSPIITHTQRAGNKKTGDYYNLSNLHCGGLGNGEVYYSYREFGRLGEKNYRSAVPRRGCLSLGMCESALPRQLLERLCLSWCCFFVFFLLLHPRVSSPACLAAYPRASPNRDTALLLERACDQRAQAPRVLRDGPRPLDQNYNARVE